MKYILVLVLLLTACATTSVPKNVEIPIVLPCDVKLPDVPDYKFGTIRPNDSIYLKAKILLRDRKLSLAYELELAAVVATCNQSKGTSQ
jgi:hypothetical protein